MQTDNGSGCIHVNTANKASTHILYVHIHQFRRAHWLTVGGWKSVLASGRSIIASGRIHRANTYIHTYVYVYIYTWIRPDAIIDKKSVLVKIDNGIYICVYICIHTKSIMVVFQMCVVFSNLEWIPASPKARLVWIYLFIYMFLYIHIFVVWIHMFVVWIHMFVVWIHIFVYTYICIYIYLSCEYIYMYSHEPHRSHRVTVSRGVGFRV